MELMTATIGGVVLLWIRRNFKKNIFVVLALILFPSCGILNKNVWHKQETERLDSVVVKYDTVDVVVIDKEQVTDTSKTISTEEGEYVVIYGKYDIGDTVIIAPQKTIGKYVKTIKTHHGKLKNTSSTTTINTGSKKTSDISKYIKKKIRQKKQNEYNLG